jgi:hypothetical protein
VLFDRRGQRRQGRVLRLIRGAGDRLHDQIGLEHFDDVSFVAGKRTAAAFAAMPHLRISQRGLPPFGDAAQNAPPSRWWVRLEILRQDGPQRRQRGLQRGVACVVGGCAATHASIRIDFTEQALQRRGLRRGIVPVNIEGRFQAGAIHQAQVRFRDDRGPRTVPRFGGTGHDGAERTANEIPRVLNAAGARQRRRIEHGLEALPAKLPRPLRERNRPGQQLLIEIVGDHSLPKRDQDALRKRRLGGTQAIQHQLPSLIHLGGDHRVGTADLIVGLQQPHHRQQGGRHRGRTSRLIHGRQLRLKGVVEQLRGPRAGTRRICRFGGAPGPRAPPRPSGPSDRPSGWTSACAHQITGRSSSRSLRASVSLWLT